jgi:hypothetical protein
VRRFVLAVIAALLVIRVAVIATSVYRHRGLALTLHPWLSRCVLWISTGRDRRECAAH